MKRKSPIIRYRAEAADGSAPMELMIYGEIGPAMFGDGVSAEDFIKELRDALEQSSEVMIRLNSPGGDVFHAYAIYNEIKKVADKVSCCIDGVAASAASYIAMAPSKVAMAPNAKLMIHKASTGTWGNADDHTRSIERLNAVDDDLAEAYSERTGISKPDILDLMTKETWFGAKDAKKKGFVDEITEAPKLTVKDKKGLENALQQYKVAAQTVDLSTFYTPLQTETDMTDAEKAQLEAQMKAQADEIKAMKEARANDLVQAAIAAGKIKVEGKEAMVKLALGDYDSAKAMLDNMVVTPAAPTTPAAPATRASNYVGTGIPPESVPGTPPIVNTQHVPADRLAWGMQEWLMKDPNGLQALEAKNPEYVKMLQQQLTERLPKNAIRYPSANELKEKGF